VSLVGAELPAEPLVGIGSVCPGPFADAVMTLGLGRYARHLASADSLAWSYNARRHPGLGRPHPPRLRELPGVGRRLV